MTQMVLNIKDESVIPTLRKVVKAFNGVSIKRSNMSPYERSKMEARTGQVRRFENSDAFFKDMES
ncbi:MAG: hypothetical protein IJ840_00185 [Bacteroidales bacterium]|nr:hypothetical protein [Bacteroidales bacterium]